MAKGPYRDETIFRQDIVDFHNYVDTLINSGFISAFGEKRRQKINLVNGYKIIRVAENARKEELIYVCAEKSGKIKYNDNEARSLAEKYIEHSGGKCEFRPVILIEKKGKYFEIISLPVTPLFSEEIERIEWEQMLSLCDKRTKSEIMSNIITPRRNWLQRLVCRILKIK